VAAGAYRRLPEQVAVWGDSTHRKMAVWQADGARVVLWAVRVGPVG